MYIAITKSNEIKYRESLGRDLRFRRGSAPQSNSWTVFCECVQERCTGVEGVLVSSVGFLIDHSSQKTLSLYILNTETSGSEKVKAHMSFLIHP